MDVDQSVPEPHLKGPFNPLFAISSFIYLERRGIVS